MSNNISHATKKPIPISINNSLLSVNLHLGLIEDDENKMRMLVETGVAMNLGNIAYHLWVMYECLEMVGEFIQCGGKSDYDVVKLLAALDLDTSQQPLEHGNMTAVIMYHTPYLVNKREPLFLSFALGNDVSLRYVLDLPTLLAIGGSINLVKGDLFALRLIVRLLYLWNHPARGYLMVSLPIIVHPLFQKGYQQILNLTLPYYTLLLLKVT